MGRRAIVNTPHPARKKLKLEYDDVVRWNSRLIYADLTGFGEKGRTPTSRASDITSYWARSGLLSMTRDAGAADLAGGRQRRQCDRRRPLFGDRHRALSARAHQPGSLCHDLAPRRGGLVGKVSIQRRCAGRSSMACTTAKIPQMRR